MSHCCDNERHRAIWDYLVACVVAIDGEFAPTFWCANVEPPLTRATIILDPLREMAWTPDFGWRVQAKHAATGTPDGKALYLDAGSAPAPAVFAARLTAWADGDLTLTEMQPYYSVAEADLVMVLRDAVSARVGCGERYRIADLVLQYDED